MRVGPSTPERAPALRADAVGGHHQAALAQLLEAGLAPDHDLGPVVDLDGGEHLAEDALLLEKVEHLLEPAHVAELRLVEQVAHAVVHHQRVLAGVDRLHEGGDRRARSRTTASRAAPTAAGRGARDLPRVGALERSVEAVGEPAQLRLGGVAAQRDRLLADEVALEHEEEERVPRLQRDEVEVLEPRAQRARAGDHAHRVGGQRQRAGGDLEGLLQAAGQLGEEGVHLAPHRDRDRLLLHEEVDVVAVAEVRRHPARRGVRLEEVADVDQVGEVVADRRGRPGGEVDGQRVRADRAPRCACSRRPRP